MLLLLLSCVVNALLTVFMSRFHVTLATFSIDACLCFASPPSDLCCSFVNTLAFSPHVRSLSCRGVSLVQSCPARYCASKLFELGATRLPLYPHTHTQVTHLETLVHRFTDEKFCGLKFTVLFAELTFIFNLSNSNTF